MMRHGILILIIFFASGSRISFAQKSDTTDTLSYARIAFEVSDHNFGDVNQGRKVTYDFKFRNSGTFPLILQNVLTTCGCTVPDWPKEPIAPNEEGIIHVIFDSSSRIGRQNKVITIRSNSDTGDYRLRISAMVLPPER